MKMENEEEINENISEQNTEKIKPYSGLSKKNEDWFLSILGFIMILGIIIGIWKFSESLVNYIQEGNYIALYKLLAFGLIMVPTSYLILLLGKNGENDKEELLELKNERNAIRDEIKEHNQIDVLSSIRLSLNRLQEYYTINTTQAKRTFTFSLLAIIIGLGIIIIGIIYFYIDSNDITMTAITSVSGILIQFIGGAYFVMYKKSIEQLNYFYQQLVFNQNTMLAINLANSIQDSNKSSDMKLKIAEALINTEHLLVLNKVKNE